MHRIPLSDGRLAIAFLLYEFLAFVALLMKIKTEVLSDDTDAEGNAMIEYQYDCVCNHTPHMLKCQAYNARRMRELAQTKGETGIERHFREQAELNILKAYVLCGIERHANSAD